MEIPIEELSILIYDALVKKCNMSEDDASIVRDCLLYAETRGNNQGIIKLVSGALNNHPDAATKAIDVMKETPVSAKVNGNNHIGMAVLSKCTKMAASKCRESGIAAVAASGYASATGALGYWARILAEQGYVSIIMSQCSEMVAPHGSYEAVFGTNPIAIGCPAGEDVSPIILDMATSAEAYYHLITAHAAGDEIRGDVAYDSKGKLTTSPGDALRGALRVFDRSYKGSGIALMVELLAGALTGASMEDKANSGEWGSLVLALDPNLFGEADAFHERVRQMCDRVRSAKKLDGVDEILLPGERSDRNLAVTETRGHVVIPVHTIDQLREMAK